MPEATFRIALKGSLRTLSVSDGVTSLLGFTPQAFLSSELHLEDLIHSQDADITGPLFSADNPSACGEVNLRVRHADGRIRCVYGTATKEICPDKGAVLRLALRDAKSLRVQANSRDSAGCLKAVLESFEECVYFKDRNHVFAAANANTRRALSEDCELPLDLVGLTDYDLFPEEVADRYYDIEKKIFAGLATGHEVQESVDKKGIRNWYGVRRYPVKDDGGVIIGILGISSDISRGVESERTLRDIAESLQESQKIAGLGSYTFDISTSAWSSSEVLDEIFGIDHHYERNVDGWTTLIHPQDRERMQSYFTDEVLSKGEVFDTEYRIIRKGDGAERWVHGLGRLEFDSDGKPSVMRGTIQDITERKQSEAALRQSQELLQLFIQHAPAALAMFDREMRYLEASRRWREDFGLNGQHLIGRSHYEIFPEIPDRWKEIHRRALSGETLKADEDRFLRSDGVEQWIRWEVRPWLTDIGAIGGVMIFSEDITRQKQAEERLHLAASVFTHASEGITITDASGTILDVNDSFTRITGYTREEALGRNPRLLNSGRQSKEFYENMWRDLTENGQWSGEIWNRAKDGRVYAEMLTISAVRDASGTTQQYVALFSDLTSIKEREQQLERIAQYDLLTGLPNRVLLYDRLRQAMAQAHRSGRPMAIACLDLDKFRAVNDRHGHTVGDQLLMAVTHRIGLALHDGDTLARLGGDEFVVVMLELASSEDSIPIIDSLLQAASEPVQVGELTLQVSASIGVTYYPQAGDMDGDQLLRQADQAMYQAKLEGKNRYHIFDPHEDRSIRGRHEDIERVRQGLKANEFVLYYQPKVNMCTGEVLGAEALIRWQHPEAGLLPPIQFLPIIEGHPLAIELGEWVIDSALTQMERWCADGLDIPVSVNVSAQQLLKEGFVDRLIALLAAHPGKAPSRLELEILESSELHDMPLVSQVIHECSRLGVTVALDDFGTGYASLSYLKWLPVDVLKIDSTCLRDMLDDAEDLAILEGVLALATAFRRQVIAEGVETVEHGLLLLRLGCQVAQGFCIARPMPAQELPHWLASWRPDPQWLHVSALDPADRPLLYAGAEHSAWVADIEDFLRGKRRVPPVLEQSQCRFGSWMSASDLGRQVPLSVFQDIVSLHQRLHSSASEILALHVDNRNTELEDRLPELYCLRDSLLDGLDALMQRE